MERFYEGMWDRGLPKLEALPSLAGHQASLVLFLSVSHVARVVRDLIAGGYPPETPAAVVYRVSWPEELVLTCTVETLAATVREHKLWKHTLFLVGPALAASGTRSHLYHPGHFHGFRRADPLARKALRDG